MSKKIVNGNPFAAGDVLAALDMNEIANALLDSGAIELDVANPSDITIDKSAILALGDVQDALGWVAYTTGNDDIAFAETLPEGATYLGGVFEITGTSAADLKVKIFAGEEAGHAQVNDATWAGFHKVDGSVVYASAVGSYDAEGNQLSTETEGVEGAAFTIKANSSNTNVYNAEDDADFQADFGTATNAQRQLAMMKLGGFCAAEACANFNPKASKLNMRGMWRMPSMKELKDVRTNALNPNFDYGQQLGYGYWSLLEYDSMGAWYYNLGNDYDYGTNKGSSYCLRAVCEL